MEKKIEMKFYFFPTFRKIAVGGFVNQLIKKIWPYHHIIKTTANINEEQILRTLGVLG